VTAGAVAGGATIAEVGGLRVGHWTDRDAATGCTVVTFPPGTVASGEVRGGAPATREFDLLDPGRTVSTIDALLLTGGSAFGLAAAEGVVRWCEEQGRGFATPAAAVPIVVGLSLYDLGVGDASVRPGAPEGYAAALAAGVPSAVDVAGPPVEVGRVGAGTGAMVAKAVPGLDQRPGGLVSACAAVRDLRVGALVAVNASGVPGGDSSLAVSHPLTAPREGWGPVVNTTIGLVATNARLGKAACHRVAQGAHDGLARAVFPPHMRFDGDAFVAAALGSCEGAPEVDADPDAVRALAVHVVATAIAGLETGPRSPDR
jgi:L-aminopeptidase/D-esterase-like protein